MVINYFSDVKIRKESLYRLVNKKNNVIVFVMFVSKFVKIKTKRSCVNVVINAIYHLVNVPNSISQITIYMINIQQIVCHVLDVLKLHLLKKVRYFWF